VVRALQALWRVAAAPCKTTALHARYTDRWSSAHQSRDRH
jgi:hypothetical protein